MDLSDLSSLPERINQALEIFGYIDILVHNGGITNRGDVLSTDVDVAIKVMTVNYFGQLALTKGKFMKESCIFYSVNMCINYLHVPN